MTTLSVKPLLYSALLSLFVCACSLAQSGPAVSAAPVMLPARDKFHIYLLMGQSNMVGRDTRGMETEVATPRVLTLTPDGQWVAAKDPLHAPKGRIPPGRGPGLSFALEMLKADPDVTIGLVPCAVGGTPLERWVKGGDLYKKAVEKARIASGAGVIKGVLWHQGETDADRQSWADSYEDRLSKMLEDLRSDLNIPQLSIVVGQLGEFITPEEHPYVEVVRTAIKQTAEKVPHVGYADSAGLKDKGDKLHFDADAQIEFGKRYAGAMEQLSP